MFSLEEHEGHSFQATDEAGEVRIKMEGAAFSWGYRIKEKEKGAG